jgi:cytochrome c biogenesis protein CcdA
MIINELFNVQLFNIILGLILLILGINFIGFLNLSINLPKFKFKQDKNFFSSFVLGIVYTFSICPSCTGFLLGATTLAVATENFILAVLTMVVYALGRSLIIFILGFLFNVQSIQQFILKNYAFAKRFTGFVFILLAIYFFQKGLLL